MKIICTAEEAAEIIYACGASANCGSCALNGICAKSPNTLFDTIHIAEDGALYA